MQSMYIHKNRDRSYKVLCNQCIFIRIEIGPTQHFGVKESTIKERRYKKGRGEDL